MENVVLLYPPKDEPNFFFIFAELSGVTRPPWPGCVSPSGGHVPGFTASAQDGRSLGKVGQENRRPPCIKISRLHDFMLDIIMQA